MEKIVHILLADDDYQVLSALRCVIEQEPTWQVTREFHNAQEMILYFESDSQGENTCAEHYQGHASILLIDWELPGFHPKIHIRKIRSLCPQIKIVGLSVLMTAQKEQPNSQADTYVSKSDAPEHVIATLRDLILQLFPTQ